MNICPKMINIRRKKIDEGDVETDRLTIDPTDDSIASIKHIVVNFDEPVAVRFLAFHIKEKMYCAKYKILNAEKRICDYKNIRYVHFHFSLSGYSPNESEYLIAFLPRFIDCSRLSILTNELCAIAEWLGIKQINCIVFRYGAPVHGIGDSTHWQKQLNKAIKETKELSLLYKFVGRIRPIPISLKDKNLTISKNAPLENINVS
ncbi:MAG: hypothetical protein FWG07_02620 [Treponema sp.]|nr:hypothetical protein [Treponema sp.]